MLVIGGIHVMHAPLLCCHELPVSTLQTVAVALQGVLVGASTLLCCLALSNQLMPV